MKVEIMLFATGAPLFALAALTLAAPAFAQDVDVLALKCTMTGVGALVQGELKNVSVAPLDMVWLTETFRGADQSFVSTTEGSTSTTPILPGQVASFRGYGDKNPATAAVTIRLHFFVGAAIPATGVLMAPCKPAAQ